MADALRHGGTFCLQLPPWSAAAALTLELLPRAKAPLLVVTDGPVSLERTATDLLSLGGDSLAARLFAFPALESLPGHGAAPPADLVGERIEALRACRPAPATPPPLIVTSIQALLQRTLAPDALADRSLTLAAGQDTDFSTLPTRLAENGYTFEPEVLAAGQASLRGGILDCWPPGHDTPVRLEFFGDTVESIRRFDPAEQRSRETLATVTLPPAAEQPRGGPGTHTLMDHLPPGSIWLWLDRESITAHAELHGRAAAETGTTGHTLDPAALPAAVTASRPRAQFTATLSPLPEDRAHTLDVHPLVGLPGPGDGRLPLDRIEELRRRFLHERFAAAARGEHLAIHFATDGARDRFIETYQDDIPTAAAVTYHRGRLSDSYHAPGARYTALSDADLYGQRRDPAATAPRRPARARRSENAGERLHAWTDVQPGDFVVHLDHGIGIYRGLYEIELHGRLQEVLTIEYAEGARLHVPVAQTHLLSRYIGMGKRRPELHALGGKRWVREKAAAQQAVADMASQLLDTQAARDAQPGHAFAPDTAWQREFEDAFPFEETPDQARAIAEVKQDMENPRPMDRLICGDVGFGKTEVALRAAFKAVMDGKQVAVLVPTTILAQQHADTFTERMAAFPVRIATLSRFQTRAEQQDTLARLAAGAVDIVIGTHRLVQRDVVFRDLGLVIIDEEQRFGVQHKEHLKRLRRLVDVITMTATPIPRTLYMSLTGARDLSIIDTAPVERLPIETVVVENRDDIVREAILRELNREGQVFYLHNRVQTIDALHLRLARLVPEARIAVGHGQMDEHRLSEVMRAFARGDTDVLLCTTIIESGLNIPNVNTIIIDRADRFGLSELYQLRGRVGRYKRKAYAYLLLPKHGQLFFMARQRIGAIKRYASLGSGFKLAMRDLELRGAGNILGSEQSGHIASVGFDLYCQLLQRTVAQLKGEAPPPVIDVALDLDFLTTSADPADEATAAVLPIRYLEDETLRVRLYRKLAGLTDRAQVRALEAEWRDRFGPLPESAQRLLLVSDIKLAAAARRITRVEVSGEKVIMTRDRDYLQTNGRFPRLPDTPPTEKLRNLLALLEALPA